MDLYLGWGAAPVRTSDCERTAFPVSAIRSKPSSAEWTTSTWAATSAADWSWRCSRETGLPINQSLLDSAREVLTRRLDYLGIQKAEVTVDTVGNRLLVRFPNQPGITQSDYPGIVSILTARSALTLRDGIASDEQGRPTGRSCWRRRTSSRPRPWATGKPMLFRSGFR